MTDEEKTHINSQIAKLNAETAKILHDIRYAPLVVAAMPISLVIVGFIGKAIVG